MAGLIPQAFIDDLLERTDVVELIQRYVPLKKAGSEFAACCPFHSEKTPSFYVSPRKQFYHCFGCGAHGTAISFLMEHENLSFPEAVGQLAEWTGLEVPRDADPAGRDPTRHLLDALEAAATFYREQLKASRAAIDYLEGRGIDGATARDYALGWAPGDGNSLAQALRGRFDNDTLVAAGLVSRRDDGRLRDRFRARIMFPIRDRRGRVTGFGARLIAAGEPKYLNSPESAVFHKGHTVYGLFEARKAETRLSELVVTEGYMDVVGLARAGFRRAVACMGTALTRDHLDLLFRQVPRLVLCFDGDDAGRRAAWRSIEQALPVIRGLREIRVLFLPEGDDPDSLVRREGLTGWQQRLDAAVMLSETFLQLLSERHPLETAEGRSQCAHAGIALIRTVKDPLFQRQLLELLAERTQTDRDQIESMLAAGPEDRGHPSAPAAARPPQTRPEQAEPASGSRQLWAALLARILQLPQQGWDAPEVRRLAGTNTRAAGILEAMIRRIGESPAISTARLLEHFRDETFFPRLAALAGVPLDGEDPELSRRIALDSAERLFEEHCRARIRALATTGRPLESEQLAELRRLQQWLVQRDSADRPG
ncbi:DNA primase [Thioalkalivibrio nitratireducens DSM 14787]|uniref:DNA primase n=1 Tax=Thioalkalivibrio nitratireducens (strain DSM 14787 / UNIQEM 213 / ALEN2) TaxID=1255043 RepID=L0E1P6_THIND|nr:DNA primase [Thioalkalivibrio nitratireducens]AGA35130.1 DNA primase [Thioalkalivibrio nitratireducens DSM 14787]